MFRDPAFFRALREQVVPVLKTYPSPTLWVAGCCTGEEALSLAIVLHEEGLLERSTIYATDINPQALATAARGVYPLHRMADYGDNYLAVCDVSAARGVPEAARVAAGGNDQVDS